MYRNAFLSTLALFGCWLMGIPFGNALPQKSEGHPATAILSMACVVVLVLLCARTYGGNPRVRARDCMIGFTIVAVVSAILSPIFASAHKAAAMGISRKAAKNLGQAELTYASDHDDRFPPASAWYTLSAPYFEAGQPVRDPRSEAPYTFAMNRTLGAAKLEEIDDPTNTALIFEHDDTNPNASGGKDIFTSRHGETGDICLADGTVAHKDPNDLTWSSSKAKIGGK